MLQDRAEQIWADGPSSAPNMPEKVRIRRQQRWLEDQVMAGLSNGGLIYDTKANMNADLAHPANASAWVVDDATAASNGIYRKSGGSGSGSWVRVADLPYSVIYAQNDGSGTANTVVATASVPVSATAYSQLVSVPFTAANTGAMTLSINGEAPRALVLNVGSPVPTGYVTAGMSALVQIDSAGNYRLYSYGDASAIQAAAEAAASAAAAAAESAAAATKFFEVDTPADIAGVTVPDDAVVRTRTLGRPTYIRAAADPGHAFSKQDVAGHWYEQEFPQGFFDAGKNGLVPSLSASDVSAALADFDGFCAAKGKMLKLPGGAFSHAGTLKPSLGVDWIGDGPNSTLLYYTGDDYAAEIFGTSMAATNGRLWNLQLRGENADPAARGLHYGNVTRNDIGLRNVRIANFGGYGIEIEGNHWIDAWDNVRLFACGTNKAGGTGNTGFYIAPDTAEYSVSFYELAIEGCGHNGDDEGSQSISGGMFLRGPSGGGRGNHLRFFGGCIEGNYGATETYFQNLQLVTIMGGYIESGKFDADGGPVADGRWHRLVDGENSHIETFGVRFGSEAVFAGQQPISTYNSEIICTGGLFNGNYTGGFFTSVAAIPGYSVCRAIDVLGVTSIGTPGTRSANLSGRWAARGLLVDGGSGFVAQVGTENITSVSLVSTGRYQVDFAVPLVGNYVPVVTGRNATGPLVCSPQISQITSTYFQFLTLDAPTDLFIQVDGQLF